MRHTRKRRVNFHGRVDDHAAIFMALREQCGHANLTLHLSQWRTGAPLTLVSLLKKQRSVI